MIDIKSTKTCYTGVLLIGGFSTYTSVYCIQIVHVQMTRMLRLYYNYYMSSTTFYRGTGLTVHQIANILEGKVRLPEITSITLIPNDDN